MSAETGPWTEAVKSDLRAMDAESKLARLLAAAKEIVDGKKYFNPSNQYYHGWRIALDRLAHVIVETLEANDAPEPHDSKTCDEKDCYACAKERCDNISASMDAQNPWA